MDHSPGAPLSWRQSSVALHGKPLPEALEQHRDELAAAMLGRLRADLPSYARLAQSEPEDQVVDMARQFLGYYIEAFRSRELPTQEMLAPVRSAAERRATGGVPMEEVMSAFHLAAGTVTEEVARLAGTGGAGAAIAVQSFGFDLMRIVALAVATGYTSERQSILGEELAARQTLVADLLDGSATDESALRAGVRLPAAYIVTAVSLGDRDLPEDDERVRRAIRRIRHEATRIIDEPVLWASPRSGWIAFVPHPAGTDWVSMDDRVWLAVSHREVQAVVDLPIYTGWAAATPQDVPEAARLARDVCDVVRATHRPPGIYSLDDVLVDYQLMRPSAARNRFKELLTPLVGRPELLQTLRTYLETGRDRRRTAQLLHLHPNSVDNRLRRCADLSGLDATDAEEAIVVRAALLAWPANELNQP
ncbi:MAG TPA: helix-turn-helix domain-containing protein [Intrasporangium sp.]|uniref:PucR family transcriptional regulator n=1 Tax=Intrasporangium sp. TaxID=1925024 RepID=UPI002B478A53|nr:helix-turn-helix domain-containing protein [Intrasporangium sp.]HKX68790.1 helix-turn-helix domain-containing protein [Intrasporangium sp.]